MAECEVCHTPLERRGTRMFCPACLLKDLWTEYPEEEMLEKATMPALPPQDMSMPNIPRHRILAKLGEGGFAVVYRAMQLEPVKREVAVKVLRANIASEHVLARFETERQTLARMEHPGIARLWDAGQTDAGQPFFAMELVRGVPITSYVAMQRLSLRQRLQLFIPVCQAIQHAHEKGVLHRDLKPSNLLVDDQGNVKIIDFGIAKALEVAPEDQPAFTTSIHQAIGTPGYMSPEQAEWGSTVIDARSDIYALGVLLFELVTGHTPLDMERRTNIDARRRAVATSAPAPSRTDGSLLATKTERRDLDAIILKALERESSLRYPSAAALADEIERHLGDKPVEAAQQSMTYLVSKFARRNRGLVAAVGVAVLSVLAGIAALTKMFLREQHYSASLDRALHEAKKNGDEIQRRLSRESFAAAQRFKDINDYQSAAAMLARSLESDPTFGVAAADLQSVLAYGEFIQPLQPALPMKKAWGEIVRGAVSGDGRTMAVQFQTKGKVRKERLMLWQRMGESWQEHELSLEKPVTQLAMSGHGKVLVHVEAARTVCVTSLDGVTQSVRKWTPPTPVTGLTVDTGGRSAIVGCNDGSVWRLFADASLQPERLFKLPHAVTHLVTNNAQQFVVAGSDDGEVHRWAPGRPDSLRIAKMPAPVAVLMQPSAVGPTAIGDRAGNVALVKPGIAANATILPLHKGSITALAIASPESIISAGTDMQIRWFDVASGKDVQPPVDIAGPVQKIDFARGDVDATFVTRDASVRQWRHGDDSPLTLRKPQRSLFVAMSLTGRCLVVQRDDGASLEVLSLSGHSAARALLHPGGARQRGTAQPRTLAFASDGEALLSVDGRANAVGWNTSDAQLMNDNLWPRAALAAMAVGDNKLVAAMTDGSFAETTPDGRAVVEILKADVADVLSPLSNTGLLRWQAACISPDGSGAAWAETSAGPERECEVRVFFRDTNKVESYRWNRISCLAFDAARGTLILGLHNGTVRIVDVHGTRQKSFSWHLSHVTSLALSRDGNLLITGSSDGTIALWDPVHGTPLSDYMRLGKPVLGVTLSGDGKRFAVATDESFMVGDVATRALIGPRLSLPGFGGAIALNEDGTRVAVTDADGIVEACHIAPNSSAPPAWFHQLVSTYVARRFVGQGVLWTSDNPELGLIYQSIPNDASGPWNQFARWLLDHPGARAMSPWSTLSLGDYLEAVRARPGDVSQQEIRKYGPDVISIREGQSQ